MTRRITVGAAWALLAWLFMTLDSYALAKPGITSRPFGTAPDGAAVTLYTLTNANGLEAGIITYGGIIVSLKTPDRTGAMADIVLGFDTLDGYLKGHPYFGAIVGRYGNRIANGQFVLDGKTYPLAKNNGPNALHGGLKGFDKAVWKARIVEAAGDRALELTHVSPDGDEGYPGKLSVTVTYTLTAHDELRIAYRATTDKPTVVNLTNHTYFNLAGPAGADILQHQVMLDADRFTPVSDTLIPTGELRPVQGTPFDFRTATAIGARINGTDEQLRFGKGYDHNFVLDHRSDPQHLAARVTDPSSGRVLEMRTSEPGVQFYTGNFLDGTLKGKGGKTYGQRAGFCLETQHYPDSPNQPKFPSAVLRPGARYDTTTVYRFTTDAKK